MEPIADESTDDHETTTTTENPANELVENSKTNHFNENTQHSLQFNLFALIFGYLYRSKTYKINYYHYDI